MSRAWLQGDLRGVAPRAELALLRQALADGIDRGEDVSGLVIALTRMDPVAGAELIAGARAIAHPAPVKAALQVAAELETVLPVAGLYRRLADLAPSCLSAIVIEAAERHVDADWWWRLSSRERPPGRTALDCSKLTAELPYRALAYGYTEAVVERAQGGDVPALRAVYSRCERDVLLRTLVGVIERRSELPVVAYVAAWHGPDIDPLFHAVARRLGTPASREALRSQAADLPATSETLRVR